jgi:hypothetical protein
MTYQTLTALRVRRHRVQAMRLAIAGLPGEGLSEEEYNPGD